MIPRQTAILNDLPEGAYIEEVVSGSPAGQAGVEPDDIITHINGERLTTDNDLAKVISTKKVGDQVSLAVWRNGQELNLSARLGNQSE